MEYIVDFQAFRRSSNLFIVKELAILPMMDERLPVICLFEAPCKWKKLLQEERKRNEWIQNYLHGIPWNSGSVPYNCLVRILQDSLRDSIKIYVKGLEKKTFLQELLPGKYIINLDDINCPSLKRIGKSKHSCQHHTLRFNQNFTCAIRNAYVLRTWLTEHQQELRGVDEVDSSIQKSVIFEKIIPMYF